MSDNMVWFRGRRVTQDSLEEYYTRKADEARDERLIDMMNGAHISVKKQEWQGMEGFKEVKE